MVLRASGSDTPGLADPAAAPNRRVCADPILAFGITERVYVEDAVPMIDAAADDLEDKVDG